MNKEKREVKKYRTIKKWFFYMINFGYLIGMITCFICNLVIDHKLSWFLIVLLGILISFTLTTVPFYLKNNKYRFSKISLIVTFLVYLLLFTINYVYNGNWLLGSFLIASFVFLFLWISIFICTFTKIALLYKVSICLLMVSFITIFTNPVCAKVLDIPANDSNISNIICAAVMIAIAIYLSFKQFFRKKRLFI